MKRREFIALLSSVAVASPLAAPAQQPTMPVIGFLRSGPPPKSWVSAFQQGLRERGYVDGQNVVVEIRFTDGSVNELPRLAEELVRLKANVIVASGAPSALAAGKANTSVPIVFAGVYDPVGLGLVQSLGHPAGNITGVAQNPADLSGKRLELLREIIPNLRRVGVILDRTNPSNRPQFEGAELATRLMNIQLERLPIVDPKEFEATFAAVRGADGVLLLDSPLFLTHGARLIRVAATNHLPVIYGVSEFIKLGGLISYGTNYTDLYQRAAAYVDNILKGAKPADLPVEQPTKFELVVNLNTAKALGITIPPTLLARADEVIE
jgi:putative tryptophan/tyrosine transport system substrate-binding protein